MSKRNPYIAAIMLGLAIGGTIIAVLMAGRYILYNPIEVVSIASLPSEAVHIERHQFTPFQDIELSIQKNSNAGNGLASGANDFFGVSDFSNVSEHERVYELSAQTKSAVDPLKDEFLREQLRQLIALRNQFQGDRIDLLSEINERICRATGCFMFRYELFNNLMLNAVPNSMENPNVYPLRQAEVKKNFYSEQREKASLKISAAELQYSNAVDDQLTKLINEQQNEINGLILEIQNYLVAKTEAIEKQVTEEGNGNSES